MWQCPKPKQEVSNSVPEVSLFGLRCFGVLEREPNVSLLDGVFTFKTISCCRDLVGMARVCNQYELCPVHLGSWDVNFTGA